MQSNNFTQNVAQGLSAIGVGGGWVAILGSTFKANTGSRGGALYVSNASRVTIQGSGFEGNNATFGGAILATGQARVDILPGGQQGSARASVRASAVHTEHNCCWPVAQLLAGMPGTVSSTTLPAQVGVTSVFGRGQQCTSLQHSWLVAKRRRVVLFSWMTRAVATFPTRPFSRAVHGRAVACI